jgi:hypothetical protein
VVRSGVALLVFLPNLVWQIQHHFVSLEFLKSIHTRDVGMGRASGFVLAQLWKCANPVTVPYGAPGFGTCSPCQPADASACWVGCMLFLSWPSWPPEGGTIIWRAHIPCCWRQAPFGGEQWVSSLSARSAVAVRQIAWNLAVAGLLTAAVTLPVAPMNSVWWRVAGRMNGNFRYEIGYRELVGHLADRYGMVKFAVDGYADVFVCR